MQSGCLDRAGAQPSSHSELVVLDVRLTPLEGFAKCTIRLAKCTTRSLPHTRLQATAPDHLSAVLASEPYRSRRARLTSRTLTSGTPASPPSGAPAIFSNNSRISWRSWVESFPVFLAHPAATRSSW